MIENIVSTNDLCAVMCQDICRQCGYDVWVLYMQKNGTLKVEKHWAFFKLILLALFMVL